MDIEDRRGEAAGEGSTVIGRSGVASVGVASVAAAVSGYLVLVLVARYLPPEQNAEFLVFWSLLFGGYGVLGGLQQEATRAVGASSRPTDRVPTRRAMFVPWALVIGTTCALVALAAAGWWYPLLLRGQPRYIVAVLCGALVLFAGHLALVGTLAGLRQWNASAVLTGGEPVSRLVVVVVAIVLGAGLTGVELAVTASAVFWLVVLLASGAMRAWSATRVDDRPSQIARRSFQAMLAAAGGAALVVGFPTLLRLSSTPDEWATAAPLILAVSLTRAPLLMPLNAYQGVAISYFMARRIGRLAALGRILSMIAAVGVVGAILAAIMGPWLMAVLFGAAYRLPPLLLAELTLAAAVLAALTITGACVLAVGRHRLYAAGWLVAAVGSALMLIVNVPLAERALLSLVVGPLLGVALHLASLGRVGQSVEQESQR